MTGSKQEGRLAPVQIDEPSTPLLRMIGHNERLVPLYRELTRVLVRESGLPARERWLITMRMAWRCNCEYEFGRHSRDAPSSEAPALVQLPTDSDSLDDADRRILRLADQIHEEQNIDDPLWLELNDHYAPAEIIEMVTLAGLYFMAAAVANSCAVSANQKN